MHDYYALGLKDTAAIPNNEFSSILFIAAHGGLAYLPCLSGKLGARIILLVLLISLCVGGHFHCNR